MEQIQKGDMGSEAGKRFHLKQMEPEVTMSMQAPGNLEKF